MIVLAAKPAELVKNFPPAQRAGPLPSSYVASASTPPSPSPSPGWDQLEPSHLAMRRAGAPPALLRKPPANSAGPRPSSKTPRAWTPPAPLPSGDQLVPFHLATPDAATLPARVKPPAA